MGSNLSCFNGLRVYENQILKGSNIAWKARGKVMVSPAIFSLIKDADKELLGLIVKKLKIIDLDDWRITKENARRRGLRIF